MTDLLSRRHLLRIGALGVGATLLSACTSGAPAAPAAPGTSAPAASGAAPITIKHEVGQFTLQKPATKVAALQFQFMEALLALNIAPTALADEQQPGGLPNLPQQIQDAVTAKGWKWISL